MAKRDELILSPSISWPFGDGPTIELAGAAFGRGGARPARCKPTQTPEPAFWLKRSANAWEKVRQRWPARLGENRGGKTLDLLWGNPHDKAQLCRAVTTGDFPAAQGGEVHANEHGGLNI
jgi:hypothetical protein